MFNRSERLSQLKLDRGDIGSFIVFDRAFYLFVSFCSFCFVFAFLLFSTSLSVLHLFAAMSFLYFILLYIYKNI